MTQTQGTIIIRGEAPSEVSVSTEILRQAFRRDNEVRLAAALRASAEFHKDLSVVAECNGEILGYALYVRSVVSGELNGAPATFPGAVLAVIGVRPQSQKMGAGERLVRHGVERCRGLGIELVFTWGLPNYFSRIGFEPTVPLGLSPEFPVPGGLLGIDLKGGLLGKLKGKVTLPAALKPQSGKA